MHRVVLFVQCIQTVMRTKHDMAEPVFRYTVHMVTRPEHLYLISVIATQPTVTRTEPHVTFAVLKRHMNTRHRQLLLRRYRVQ